MKRRFDLDARFKRELPRGRRAPLFAGWIFPLIAPALAIAYVLDHRFRDDEVSVIYVVAALVVAGILYAIIQPWRRS